jgi:sugar phosphate isomerase/epimerase
MRMWTAFVVVAMLSVIAMCAIGQQEPVPAKPAPRDDGAAEGLGWKLAVQTWTFRDRTAIEAIATAERLGIKYLEMYPGQELGKAFPGAKVGPDLSDELRGELKRSLALHNVKLMNFGVVNFKNDEAAARRVFEFARDMGIQTITCEPEMSAWDLVERLAEEFKINAACHDHPKPTAYWNPDTVLEAIKGRSKRLGACADTGHWTRSELVPVECLKKLEGRIISLHFKDISPPGLRGTDRPWGSGDGNARGMLEELRRQGFRGVIAVEYESGAGAELEANVAKCIAWFDSVARELGGQKR